MRGINPGARVVRGVDWQWEDQDGEFRVEQFWIKFWYQHSVCLKISTMS